jgi:lipoate-protein ligase A
VSVHELYDYDELRGTRVAAMFVGQVTRPTLVLGSSQSDDVLDATKLASAALRRRRGGGGLVLLRPDDLWVDWWLPAGDRRWSSDVRVSSVRAGAWWAGVLSERTDARVTVHEGPLEGAPAHRVVCFAGRGPGEVFLDDRKAVGLTQWRVREGVLVSTVLRTGPTAGVLEYLRAAPSGLRAALDGEALGSRDAGDTETLVEALRTQSESPAPRHHRIDD